MSISISKKNRRKIQYFSFFTVYLFILFLSSTSVLHSEGKSESDHEPITITEPNWKTLNNNELKVRLKAYAFAKVRTTLLQSLVILKILNTSIANAQKCFLNFQVNFLAVFSS